MNSHIFLPFLTALSTIRLSSTTNMLFELHHASAIAPVTTTHATTAPRHASNTSSTYATSHAAIPTTTHATIHVGVSVTHPRHKRQTNLAPQLPLSSYTFTLSQCTAGAYIGTITANGAGSGPVTYSADIGTGNPYGVCVSPTSGSITLQSGASGTFQFNFRAANSYGAMVSPVTVICSGTSTNTGVTSSIYGGYGCYTTPANNGYSAGGISPPNTPYAYNPYNTGGIGYGGSVGYNPYSSYPYSSGSSYPYSYNTVSSYPYNTGTYPYTLG